MKLPSISKLLFFKFLVIYLAVAVYISYFLQIYHNDAISRTALGFFTIFGRNPHMAAIGFVWQPLPSLLQIPLIELLRPFNLMLLSGPLVTSISGTISVTTIYKIGLLLNKKKKLLALTIAILFGLNPMIILYSAIGTSEAIFIASLLMSTYYFLRWELEVKQQYLLLASIFISLSFWSRYESLPAFAACMILILIRGYVDKLGLKKTESAFLQYISPFVYSVFFWMLLNWLIMKNPFYFLNSPYSNSAFTTVFKSNPTYLEHSYHSIINSFNYMMKRVLYLAPIVLLISTLPFVLTKLSSKKIKDSMIFLFLTAPYFSILMFHVYQLYKGESFGWLRFFTYSIILGSFIALYLSSKHKILAIASILFLILGIITTGYAMNSNSLGSEEESFVKKIKNASAVLDYSRTYEDQKKIALLMNNVDGKILLDIDKGFAVPLFSKNPQKYVITSDVDFVKIVKNYPDYVDWIIIPKPGSNEQNKNKIYTYYPNIWEGKAPSVYLYTQIDDWRIFKVEKHPLAVNKNPKTLLQCKYVIASGDSLWRIARNKLGSGKEYLKIVELNSEINSDFPIIYPNQKLTIPCSTKT